MGPNVCVRCSNEVWRYNLIGILDQRWRGCPVNGITADTCPISRVARLSVNAGNNWYSQKKWHQIALSNQANRGQRVHERIMRMRCRGEKF